MESLTLKQEFGKRLRRWRRFRDYTQESFAEVLDVTTMTISNFERGKTGPSFGTLQQITEILQVPVRELFPEQESKSPIY